MNRGFGLIALLVVVALIALLFGGAKWFSSSVKGEQTSIEASLEAKQQAEAVKKLIENRDQQILESN